MRFFDVIIWYYRNKRLPKRRYYLPNTFETLKRIPTNMTPVDRQKLNNNGQHIDECENRTTFPKIYYTLGRQASVEIAWPRVSLCLRGIALLMPLVRSIEPLMSNDTECRQSDLASSWAKAGSVRLREAKPNRLGGSL